MDESEEPIQQASASLDQGQELAMKAKDRALAWVYALDWLAVTGTTLVCGFVLRSMMV